jgi:hypothetical protein
MPDFNMPPGVSVNDIPGNRPEDMAEEAFWNELDLQLTASNINGIGPLPAAPSANYVSIEHLLEDENFQKIITIARDLGFNHGYGQGLNDMALGKDLKEQGEIRGH